MKREWSIYCTLRALARQRVAAVLQPGGILVVERATEETKENIRTCQLRGWIEPIADGVPKGRLTEDGRLPAGQVFTERSTVYRLTDSGWNAIHRSHVITLLGLIAALLAIVATLL
jgi:hypothetical protein